MHWHWHASTFVVNENMLGPSFLSYRIVPWGIVTYHDGVGESRFKLPERQRCRVPIWGRENEILLLLGLWRRWSGQPLATAPRPTLPQLLQIIADMSASLLIAWQLKNKHVLVVGGGQVASSRIRQALAAGANLTVVSPVQGLSEETKSLIDTVVGSDDNHVIHRNRTFVSTDLENVDMALTAIDDVDLSREIGTLCRARRIPVNVADDPAYCDFYFGSQIRQGPLQIMVSTNGKSPKLANIIRRKIEECIPEGAGEAIDKVGRVRERLKERAPGVGGDVSKRRMKWMVDLCTSWELDDLASLDDGQIEKMLDDGWESNFVPSREHVMMS
jgi:precorrin-2 dehydrogenase / sirohydrochlorin ferrochelatase